MLLRQIGYDSIIISIVIASIASRKKSRITECSVGEALSLRGELARRRRCA
jgi:hypothetical protein